MTLIHALMILAATTTLAPGPAPAVGPDGAVHVDCAVRGAFERALRKAEQTGRDRFVLHGVCRGFYEIDGIDLTLTGATPDDGLAAPDGEPTSLAVLTVRDAAVAMQRMTVSGGIVGVLVEGQGAELFVGDSDIRGQQGAGVLAERHATARVFDSRVFDGGAVGVLITDDSTGFVQRSTIGGHDVGIYVTDESFAGVSETTLDGNRQVGLNVGRRSDVNVLGGAFRDNGDVHVAADDRSDVRLLQSPTIGDDDDETAFSLSAIRHASIASFSAPVLHGDVGALIGASIQLGNTVVRGDVQAIQFAEIYARNAEIDGAVLCLDGSDAICRATTTGGSSGCRSTSCADAAPPATGEPPVQRTPRPVPARPDVEGKLRRK